MTRDEIIKEVEKLVKRLTSIDERSDSSCRDCRGEFKTIEVDDIKREIARLRKQM
jgi:hypothetical protein